MHAFGIAEAKDRLVAAAGGYETVHESPMLVILDRPLAGNP